MAGHVWYLRSGRCPEVVDRRLRRYYAGGWWHLYSWRSMHLAVLSPKLHFERGWALGLDSVPHGRLQVQCFLDRLRCRGEDHHRCLRKGRSKLARVRILRGRAPDSVRRTTLSLGVSRDPGGVHSAPGEDWGQSFPTHAERNERYEGRAWHIVRPAWMYSLDNKCTGGFRT